METQKVEIQASRAMPEFFLQYMNQKLVRNGKAGRPHFIQELAGQGFDVTEETLNILELAWIKGRSFGSVAEKYHTDYRTIYRIFQDLEPAKTELIEYLQIAPRRKRWYIPETDSSDYETVQNYILRARRDGLKKYVVMIQNARRCWTALGYKDPSNWSADEVCNFLTTLKPVAQSGMLDAVRQVAPQLADKRSPQSIKTGRFREKIGRRKKDIFGKEVEMIHEALRPFQYYKTIFDLHITLGCREGSSDSTSGLSGLSWDKFKDGFKRVDVFESKVRAGITWSDCPVDLFFSDLPDRLRAIWEERGKPTSDKVIRGGYKEIGDIYKEIRRLLELAYQGKVDPFLLKEFMTIRPHDSDKIHCNLLWEAKIPLEIVAGEYLGQGRGVGLVGRGWLDINTIKKYYLTLTVRSERFKETLDQVRNYSSRFSSNGHNGGE